MFRYPRQIESVPGERKGWPVGAKKNAFADEGLDQIEQLSALELDERDGLRRHPEPLQNGEGREQPRRGGRGEVEFHPHGNRVAQGGAGEVGWQDQAEHWLVES